MILYVVAVGVAGVILMIDGAVVSSLLLPVSSS